MIDTLDMPTRLLITDSDTPQSGYANEVLKDFWICCVSREMSLMGRKEVLTGKAKFGILGDGKEVPQVALARAFSKGDFRSGYYRDQTLMMALGLLSVKEFFGQLYADPENDPHSRGRQMNAHFSTPLVDAQGQWTEHTSRYNVSADISSTAGQMARGLGLALASKLYRVNDDHSAPHLSQDGNEVVHVTIGDASTSEGAFWETLNAAAVSKVPLAVNVWDDGYGISVPREFQTVKSSISRALEGFLVDDQGNGIDMYVHEAWDYPGLVEMYSRGVKKCREQHIPALFHITECTQPQGHSTSGSHERYKNEERLQWEQDHDCITLMRKWMIDVGLATAERLDDLREEAKNYVKEQKQLAWDSLQSRVTAVKHDLIQVITAAHGEDAGAHTEKVINDLFLPSISDMLSEARKLRDQYRAQGEAPTELQAWIDRQMSQAHEYYHTHLHSETSASALQVPITSPSYSDSSESINGYQILNEYFDMMLERRPELIAFGEDVGQIGDVNQGFAGLQEKYGIHRVFDAGIREWSIAGGAIGTAMRGFRPIAEMQYLDYLVYAMSPLTDDLATLRYRSAGQQMAPAIIRTRGHRLEGIWHAGSPIGMLLGAMRGIYLLTPRSMVQAVGFYNTMLQSDDPAIIIECLNGYRLHERRPDNLGDYTVPLGVPEVLIDGTDVTLVTYGSCIREAEEACERLAHMDISVELIDVQSLLPFDLEHSIVHSVEKTNKLVLLDEDVPGGATAYMMQKILEEQQAYRYLDAQPVCITAHAHRTPFGSDGDYHTKPNADDICDRIYAMMQEYRPDIYI